MGFVMKFEICFKGIKYKKFLGKRVGRMSLCFRKILTLYLSGKVRKVFNGFSFFIFLKLFCLFYIL